LHKIDILLAEDNDVNQLVFTQILEGLNVTFRIAPNGKIAVRDFEQYRPRLIMMDVSMPEMNGLEATRRIRELEKELGLHTPIIGVTAHSLRGDQERCLAAGMDDYMSKPVSPDKVGAKIAEWMNRRGKSVDRRRVMI
jgi:CheY-like chemotaxis protein